MPRDDPRPPDGPRHHEGLAADAQEPDDDVDLSAEPGTPEHDRAQEELMIRGASGAEGTGEIDPDEDV